MKYIIVIDKQSRSNPSQNKKEYTIEIEELRRKNGVSDEFYIENGIAKVIRRIGLTEYNETYFLQKEKVEDFGKMNIQLFEGTNYIYIKDEYNNVMSATYIIKNDFTDIYVTDMQMKSAIEQSASNIILTVNQQLDTYSTKEETRAQIEIKSEEINQQVSKKVGEDEIISKINQSPETVAIDANKISLIGKNIDLTGDNISINSDSFNVSREGKVDIITEGNLLDTAMFSVRNKNETSYSKVMPSLIWTESQNGMARYGTFGWPIMYMRDNSSNTISAQIPSTGAEILLKDSSGNEAIITPKKITALEIKATSLESKKKNIKPFNKNTVDIINNTNIYEYNLKTEKNIDKKHIGLVIGYGYKTPEEVISKDGDGIELYSMTSLSWKAIQELAKILEKQDKRIQELEAKVNG